MFPKSLHESTRESALFTFKSYASLKFPKPDILYLFRFL